MVVTEEAHMLLFFFFFFAFLFFFPSALLKEKQHKATLEEQGHLVFMAFTKQLFEVELKEI